MSAGTMPAGEWARIWAFESGCRSRTLISSKGTPNRRITSQGLETPARPGLVADQKTVISARHAQKIPTQLQLTFSLMILHEP